MVEKAMHENPGNSDAGSALPQGGKTVRAVARRVRRADPRAAHLARLASEWKTEIAKCLEDCGVETVHRIRTGTRRIEAIVDVLMREAGEENSGLREAAARWRRQLSKVRRAAAPVRDLDVHRQLLATGVGQAGEQEQALEEPSPVGKQAASEDNRDPLAAQVEKLDAWLKHAREQRAGDLTKQISRRKEKLDGLAAEFAAAWQTRVGRGRRIQKPALAALDAFVELSDEMPLVDPGNLHDFRKRVKKARYVTEAGGDDAHAKAVGRAIKRIQDAIGEWHDWNCLSEEAQVALRDEGEDLSARLAAEAERRFHEAKRVTDRMRGRLVGEWRALHRV